MSLGAWIRVLQRQSGLMWSRSLFLFTWSVHSSLFLSTEMVSGLSVNRTKDGYPTAARLHLFNSSGQETTASKLLGGSDLFSLGRLVRVGEQGIYSDNATFATNGMQCLWKADYGLGDDFNTIAYYCHFHAILFPSFFSFWF